MRPVVGSRILLPAVVVAGIVLTGCGGGGGGSSSSPTPTPPDTSSAQQALNTAVRNPSGITTQNLTPTANEFDQARQQDPSDLDAQAGYAITETAIASLTIANLNGVNVPAVQAKAPRIAGPVALQNGLLIWNLPQVLASGSGLINPHDVVPHVYVSHTSTTPGQVQTELRQLDSSLVKVEQALNVVYQHPNYTFTIADPSNPTNQNATVKVGSAEFRLFGTIIALVRSTINAAVAYNADPGTFNFDAPISTAFSSYLNSNDNIPPSAYLPASPFATINSDGATRVQTVKSELQAGITDGTIALQLLQNRNSLGYLFNPVTYHISTSQLAAYQTQISGYQAYLNGPVSAGKVTVNLPAFFNHPPADLKALAPQITITQQGAGLISAQATSFPDPTFGGVISGGTTVTTAPVNIWLSNAPSIKVADFDRTVIDNRNYGFWLW